MIMKICSLEDFEKQQESYAEWKEKYVQNLPKQICPCCGNGKIGIDHWQMFIPECDWFYYCQECDYTWKLEESEIGNNENICLL